MQRQPWLLLKSLRSPELMRMSTTLQHIHFFIHLWEYTKRSQLKINLCCNGPIWSLCCLAANCQMWDDWGSHHHLDVPRQMVQSNSGFEVYIARKNIIWIYSQFALIICLPLKTVNREKKKTKTPGHVWIEDGSKHISLQTGRGWSGDGVEGCYFPLHLQEFKYL